MSDDVNKNAIVGTAIELQRQKQKLTLLEIGVREQRKWVETLEADLQFYIDKYQGKTNIL
jgi:hypothetical protein